MERQFTGQKTYRYEIEQKNRNAKKVLYVLHGYGQLAKFFIRKFNVLSDNYIIVAPEGMHRFYLEGTSGRVGASWMTKEARDADIDDNLNWLSALDARITSEFNPEEKHLLGFSQGGATAARWNKQIATEFKSITLWSCVFPPDLEKDKEISDNQSQNKYFAIGSEDEYYNKEEQNKLLHFYSSRDHQTIHYKGNHNIDENVLLEIYDS